MASSNPPQKRPHFTLEATFDERDTFTRRFEAVCKLLQPVGGPPLDNHGLFCAMFDAVERNVPGQDPFPGNVRTETKSFIRNSGKIHCVQATSFIVHTIT